MVYTIKCSIKIYKCTVQRCLSFHGLFLFCTLLKWMNFKCLVQGRKYTQMHPKSPKIPVLIDYFSIQDLKMTYPLSHNCISISIYLKLLYKLYIPSNHGFHGLCGVVQNFTFNEWLHHFTHSCLCIYSLYSKPFKLTKILFLFRGTSYILHI